MSEPRIVGLRENFERHLEAPLYPFPTTVYCSLAMTIPNVRLQIREAGGGRNTSTPKAASVLAYFCCSESELVAIACVVLSHSNVPIVAGC
jgi:hypothetical protein